MKKIDINTKVLKVPNGLLFIRRNSNLLHVPCMDWEAEEFLRTIKTEGEQSDEEHR